MSRSKKLSRQTRCLREMRGLQACSAMEDCREGSCRNFCGSEDAVSDVHSAAEHAGKGWIQIGAAVFKTTAEGVQGSICLCCGAWFEDTAPAFPHAASWRRFVDGQVSAEALARRHLALIRRGLYACTECGSVWFEDGALLDKDWRSLSLLAGVRFSGDSDFERKARRKECA